MKERGGFPEYDIVVSFAGEQRDIASRISDALSKRGFSVFYDEFEKAQLWGRNLYDYFVEVYSKKGIYCLMIVSSSYKEKIWTNLERQAAQSRALFDSQEYILPLRVDSTELPGLLPTIGYINYSSMSNEEIVDVIQEKVTGYYKKNGIRRAEATVEQVFGVFGHKFDRIEVKCPTCGASADARDLRMESDENVVRVFCDLNCQPVLVLSKPESLAWPGRGYVLGGWCVRNASDLTLYVKGGLRPVLLPRSPYALAARRPPEV